MQFNVRFLPSQTPQLTSMFKTDICLQVSSGKTQLYQGCFKLNFEASAVVSLGSPGVGGLIQNSAATALCIFSGQIGVIPVNEVETFGIT